MVGERAKLLEREIGKCKRCHIEFPQCNWTKPSGMQRGSYLARVMIIGLEPGNTEVESGVAFSGRAGRTLRSWFESIGLSESFISNDMYLTSLLKCSSGGQVKDKMIGNCRKFLAEQVKIIRPKVVIPLGSVCIKVLLGLRGDLRTIVGNVYKEHGLAKLFPGDPDFVPLPHPSPRSSWHSKRRDLLLSALQLLKTSIEKNRK